MTAAGVGTDVVAVVAGGAVLTQRDAGAAVTVVDVVAVVHPAVAARVIVVTYRRTTCIPRVLCI